MKTVTFTKFRNHASSFFSEVENGETIIILRHGKPIAEISTPAFNESKTPSWKNPGIKLAVKGKSLSKIIREDREVY
ncbi:MAG: type II toxin-antitoxin system Phd/YefM family antitoxin [bacterium]